MNNFKPYFDANKAWVNLSTRLSNEGLLPKTTASGLTLTYIPYLKIAASFAIVVTTVALVYILSKSNDSEMTFVANTVPDQTLVKTLGDGSVVYLAGNSSITFSDDYNQSKRLLKLDGEAFFEVVFNATLPFVVEMNHAKVEVLGTSFRLKNFSGQDIELVVESGKVGFASTNDPQNSILVEKGQKLVFDGRSSKKYPSIGNTVWRDKHLHFSNEKLSDILSVISRNLEVNISIADPSVAQRQLTVTFFNNTPTEIISIISEYYNLNAKFVDETNIVLSRK